MDEHRITDGQDRFRGSHAPSIKMKLVRKLPRNTIPFCKPNRNPDRIAQGRLPALLEGHLRRCQLEVSKQRWPNCPEELPSTKVSALRKATEWKSTFTRSQWILQIPTTINVGRCIQIHCCVTGIEFVKNRKVRGHGMTVLRLLVGAFSGLEMSENPAGRLRFTYPTALTEIDRLSRRLVRPTVTRAAAKRSVVVLFDLCCCLSVCGANFRIARGCQTFFNFF